MRNQFTAKRMIGLGLLTAALIAFTWYMVVEYPPTGGVPPPSQSEWNDYIPHAIVSVLLVVAIDAAFVVATLRRQRRLSDEEKDPAGATFPTNGQIDLDATTASQVIANTPLTRLAVKRTISKQHGSQEKGN
jgi:hypothetical protein